MILILLSHFYVSVTETYSAIGILSLCNWNRIKNIQCDGSQFSYWWTDFTCLQNKTIRVSLLIRSVNFKIHCEPNINKDEMVFEHCNVFWRGSYPRPENNHYYRCKQGLYILGLTKRPELAFNVLIHRRVSECYVDFVFYSFLAIRAYFGGKICLFLLYFW